MVRHVCRGLAVVAVFSTGILAACSDATEPGDTLEEGSTRSSAAGTGLKSSCGFTGVTCAPVTPIAFVRGGQVYVVNFDGTGEVRLTNGPNDAAPAWSRDGKRIAFTRESGGSTDIYVMNSDGSNVVRRTHGGLNFEPTWSPDGSRIAFAALGGGSANVYVMSADDDAKSPAAVAAGAGYDADPSWSPDGTRIAFVSDRAAYDFTFDIFLTNPGGTPVTQLTQGFGSGALLIEHYQPAWSPDGRRLAVVTCRAANPTCGVSAIELMNVDGSGRATLTPTSGFANPTWSPDGRTIAFSSAGSVQWIKTDGSARGVIVANGHSPAWLPCATQLCARFPITF